ncbi:MFS transporter [Streptomyces sp. QL37]|uniref:MFS transporter n=1 Tax=Streptomyces sp. QL37 TaxID=2093747 RepID=UPI0011B0CA87|nr:MFS transporter [Streptomyces sp. QL37]
MSAISPPHRAVARPALTTVLACLGMFAAYVPIGSVSVSLSRIQQGLGASTSDLQWVSDAFILPMAALILTFGLIGDLYGRKNAYLAGMLLFAAGSVTSLTAHGVEQVWVGQAIAGAGAAALASSTLALISHAYPDFRARAKAIAAWAASLSIGMALGPLISGVILEHATWRWIFLPAAVITAVTGLLAVRMLEDSRSAHGRAIDVPGQIAAIVFIIGLIYGVIEGGGADGWGQTKVVVAFVAAALGLIAFVVAELRSAAPMLSLKLFAVRPFTGAGVVNALVMFGMIGSVFTLSLFFGSVQQLSVLDIAWRMLVFNGVSVVTGPLVGRLMGKVAPGVLLCVGLLGVGGAMLWLTGLETDSGFGAMAGPLALFGLGMGFVMTPISAVAVGSVPHHLAGMAGAGNNTLRQLGGALGPAVLGAVLTSRLTSALPGHLADSGLTVADQKRVGEALAEGGVGAAGHLGLAPEAAGPALGAIGASFTDAVHVCMTVGAAGMLVALIATATLIGFRRPQPATPAPAAGASPATAPEAAHDTDLDDPGRAPVQDGPALHGHIRGSTGTSRPTVTLISLTGRQLGRTAARSDGGYELAVPGAGTYVLIAAADGHQPQAATVVIGDERLAYDILLSGVQGLSGIVSGADGLPVAAATVIVTGVRGEVLGTGQTGPEGDFAFGELPAGAFTVAVNAAGHRPAAVPVTVGDGGSGRVEIALVAGARLQGAVRSGADLRPLPDARVTLVDAAGNVTATATTGADGVYAFADLDAGEYSVVASGYAPVAAALRVTDSGTDALDIELSHPAT